MKFYLLVDPMKPSEFAMFSHLGTWSKGSVCDFCGVTSEKLVEPLLVEWEPGTERIGSFSWCGSTCVVTDEVRKALEEARIDCAFGRVKVVAPTGRTRHPRVPFPYCGPRLHWLVPRRVSLNLDQNRLKLESDCPHCGIKDYRVRRTGLVVDARKAGNPSLFKIDQFGNSGVTFATEPLLKMFRDHKFTNFCWRSAGNIE